MTRIEESDFRPLDEFPLKWRWTDSRWNELRADALHGIRPFTESKARELSQYSLTFSDAYGLSESQFENISRVEAMAGSPGVREWLSACHAEPDQWVVVSWDHRHAVLVRWNMFCEYWDDFCYPASDDVTVWPPCEEWALVYLHHGEFVFGERRGSVAA